MVHWNVKPVKSFSAICIKCNRNNAGGQNYISQLSSTDVCV